MGKSLPINLLRLAIHLGAVCLAALPLATVAAERIDADTWNAFVAASPLKPCGLAFFPVANPKSMEQAGLSMSRSALVTGAGTWHTTHAIYSRLFKVLADAHYDTHVVAPSKHELEGLTLDAERAADGVAFHVGMPGGDAWGFLRAAKIPSALAPSKNSPLSGLPVPPASSVGTTCRGYRAVFVKTSQDTTDLESLMVIVHDGALAGIYGESGG